MTAARAARGEGWENLPPHLSQPLFEALDALNDAFEDADRPLSPQLQALWDVTDQIEEWILAMEHLKETVSDFRE